MKKYVWLCFGILVNYVVDIFDNKRIYIGRDELKYLLENISLLQSLQSIDRNTTTTTTQSNAFDIKPL